MAASNSNDTANPAQLITKLDSLKASATKEYALKNYIAAAEHYSEAAEVQDELNGEMSPNNADLLYQYGRCLYHVAVSRSDVLGGRVASAEEPKRKKRKVAPAESSAAGAGSEGGLIGDAMKDGEQKLAEGEAEAEKSEVKKEDTFANKPFFQITGDENYSDSEEDDDEDAADAEAEEDEDDFAIAYEILDVARVLLIRKLEASQEETDGTNGKAPAKDSPETRQLKERLADTHDLQAEISLENERFTDAITDTRDALTLKLVLYPQESSLVAEAHYKLSLALEFASVTSTADESTGEQKVSSVDEEMRKEAAGEMEKAIASCKLRIEKETASLATLPDDKKTEQERSIEDVKDMVGDMETRLTDLRNPAVSLSASDNLGPAGEGADELRGLMGQLLGQSKTEKQQSLKAATEGANDLTGLVKHKKKAKVEPAGPANGDAVVEGKGKGKRTPDQDVDEGRAKKVKFEDAA